MGALMIGVIFLIAGVGTAALFFVLGGLSGLFVSAAVSLVTSQSST